MQEGPITTILVHSMLNRQANITRRDPPIKMQYEEYNPPNYHSEMNDRIRCRSFYIQKSIDNDISFKKDKRKNPLEHKSIENGQLGRELNKIDVEFETLSRSKSKKDRLKSKIPPNEYYTLMANSMNNYITKVEKGKRRKLEKCQKIKQFGVNIQSIRATQDCQQKFPPRIKRKEWSLNSNTRNLTPYHQHSGSKIRQQESTENPSIPMNIVNRSNIVNKQSSIFTTNISASSSMKKTKFFSKKVVYRVEKEENSVGNKLNKMLSSFSVILNSYCVRLDRPQARQLKQQEDVPKYKRPQKYTYYIGKGNNKNLLISLLKKRWWWTEADDINSANFVWTQLKVTSILQKQSSMMYSSLEDADPNTYRTQKQDPSVPKAPFNHFFHINFSDKFYFKLSEKDEKKYMRLMEVPAVLHNHYEANYMLGNKKALFYNMIEYKSYRGEDPFQFLPLTYHIEKVTSKSFKMFEKKAKQKKKSIWIVKPGENSNRGQGIFVSDSVDKIKKLIEKDKSHTFIIQKYLKNIFTFQRRKFDIRTYLLMVSFGGIKKFYWYSEGYLRTSSEIYDLTDLDDPFIHLTNDAIQSHGDNYGKFEKGNKVTYHQFQRYLDLNYANEKYSVSGLIERMKNIAKQVVEATYFKIDPCRKQCSLQLFGMDFIIDSNFKPWLLEVNTNPCLELSGPVLERLIPRMMENLFRIAIDPIFQPSQNSPPRNLACYIPQNILQRNRFQLIFDTLYDRNEPWQIYSLEISQGKVYEDENEEFESDGELIKIDD